MFVSGDRDPAETLRELALESLLLLLIERADELARAANDHAGLDEALPLAA